MVEIFTWEKSTNQCTALRKCKFYKFQKPKYFTDHKKRKNKENPKKVYKPMLANGLYPQRVWFSLASSGCEEKEIHFSYPRNKVILVIVRQCCMNISAQESRKSQTTRVGYIVEPRLQNLHLQSGHQVCKNNQIHNKWFIGIPFQCMMK